MPRTRRIPPPYLEKPEGQRTILDFYRKKDKNGGTTGRPKGSRNKKGRKPNKKKYRNKDTAISYSSSSSSSSSSAAAAAQAPKKKRSTYTNWQIGEGLLRLEKAVKTWFDTPKSERMSKNNYAKSVGIPTATLKTYLEDDR